MGPGDTAARVAYWIDDRKYSQTFYYCAECARQVESEQSYENRLQSRHYSLGGALIGMLIAAFTILLPCMVLASQWKREPGSENNATGAVVVGFAGLFGGAMLGLLASKRLNGARLERAKEQYPQRERQAVWGAAAYMFCESGVNPAFENRYRAVRFEWLKELGELNAEQLDGPSYELVFGKPKLERQ